MQTYTLLKFMTERDADLLLSHRPGKDWTEARCTQTQKAYGGQRLNKGWLKSNHSCPNPTCQSPTDWWHCHKSFPADRLSFHFLYSLLHFFLLHLLFSFVCVCLLEYLNKINILGRCSIIQNKICLLHSSNSCIPFCLIMSQLTIRILCYSGV